MSVSTVSSNQTIATRAQPTSCFDSVWETITGLISSLWEQLKTCFCCCYQNEPTAAPTTTAATTTPTVPATTTVIVPETRAETRPAPPTAPAPAATQVTPSPAESAQRRSAIATRLHEILPNTLLERDHWLKRFVWDVYELETRLSMHVTLNCIWRDGFFCLQIGATGKPAEELHTAARCSRGFSQLHQTAPSNPLLIKIDPRWFSFRSAEELNQVTIPTTPNKNIRQALERRNAIYNNVSSQLPIDVSAEWINRLTAALMQLETRLNIPVSHEFRTYQIEDENVEGRQIKAVYFQILVEGVGCMELLSHAGQIHDFRNRINSFRRAHDRLGSNNTHGLNPDTVFIHIQ